MKKLFTLFVAICATTLAWADDNGSCGENVTYSFMESTGTLTISGTGAMKDNTLSDAGIPTSPWDYLRSAITTVVIEDGVTSIGNYAFSYCNVLTSITIPNSVTSIGEEAFIGCTGLTSVTIPNSITSIGTNAFCDCTELTSVTIPNSVTSIGNYAFRGCTGLTSIAIPNNVTSIGNYAFSECTGLTSITIPNSVTSIGSSTFGNCTGLTSINVAEDNLNYASIDGVLYNKDKNTLITCPMGKTGSVTIPNSVTSIGEYAFYGCTRLTSINVAEDNLNYASIDGVLYNKDKNTLIMCPLGKTGSITIPNSVTSIGGWAFRECTGLTSMTVEATNPPLCVNNYGLVGLGMPNYNIPLYVPAGSVDAYKAADEWKKFTNIQAIPATGVNEAAAEKSEVKKIMIDGTVYIEAKDMRYNLNGQKVK